MAETLHSPHVMSQSLMTSWRASSEAGLKLHEPSSMVLTIKRARVLRPSDVGVTFPQLIIP